MRKFKHIIALFLVTAILSGIAYFLPKLDTSSDNQTIDDKTELEIKTDTILTIKDSIPFVDRLKKELQVLQTSYSKRKKRDNWTLGKGQSILVYLLQAQKFTKKNGGRVLNIEELYENQAFLQSAQIDILPPEGDTLNLRLHVSENIFRSNASVLSVAFQVTSITPEIINELNKLDYPYDLLVPPFGSSDSLLPNLRKIQNKELVLWLAMESTTINKIPQKLRPLRIHHTSQQIESFINSAMQAVPGSVGIATRFGEQAVEHKQLLQAILEPLKSRNLWFIDLSMNKLSKVPEMCKNISMQCKISTPYNPENSSIEDYVKQRLREAPKSGTSALILPLSLEAISQVKDLSEKVKKQGTTIVNLSTFITY